MNKPVLTQIERLFSDSDGGEFVVLPREAPYCVVPAPTEKSPILYCTKPQLVLSCLDRLGISPFAEIGLVGRYGLPQPDDADWLGQMLKHRAVGFLGDLDAVDLTIFAWLGRRFPSARITYLGLGDDLLSAAGIAIGESSNLDQMASPEEQQQQGFVRTLLPELETLVGQASVQKMESGRKLELPAVFSQQVPDPVGFARFIGTWPRRLR
jgi:hypothetical protein